MTTCTKRFEGYPAAHRQPRHDGHCSLIHGHDWAFTVEFGATSLDDNNFVFDFGKLQSVKGFFAENFDHTLVLNFDDPELELFRALADKRLCKLVVVESASAEGLAKLVFEEVTRIMASLTLGRVFVTKVICHEDHKNSATYTNGH